MRHSRARVTVPLLLVVVAVALAGCTASESTATPSHSPSTKPTASTPTADPTALPANALFRITATVTATGSNQSVVNLVETVFKPTNTISSADAAAWAAQCKGDPTSKTYLTADVVATQASGSAPWPAAPAQSEFIAADLGEWAAWTGGFKGIQSTCVDAIPSPFPGNIHGVSEVLPSADAATATNAGWAKGTYGFSAYKGSNGGTVSPKAVVTFSNCAITLSSDAAADSVASAWPTATQKHGGCQFGKNA